MAKKFGKFLLLTATLSAAAAAAYYYLQKKDSEIEIPDDDDYDDFSDNETITDSHTTDYVTLNQTPSSASAEADSEISMQSDDSEIKEDSFTPLKDTLTDVREEVEESVEEFFDEEDSSDEEPPILDN